MGAGEGQSHLGAGSGAGVRETVPKAQQKLLLKAGFQPGSPVCTTWEKEDIVCNARA